MSSKARVSTRLKQAVGSTKSSNKSSDLTSAASNFEVMKKRLRLLINALKAHHQSLILTHKTRTEAVKLVATLSLNSPIFECAGQLTNEGAAQVCSYASVHSSMAAQQKLFCDKYGQFVVNYAVEWEKVLTDRITTGLKKTEQMRIELDHYEDKVKSIRVSVNVAIAKGKMVDPKLSERLRRNDEKFTSAKISYEKFVHALAVLIDEATLRSWKDLHPLLIKMTQYDVTVVKSEAKALSGLDTVVQKLKSFTQEHNLGQSRLKDLATMDAFELSGINETEYLALNASPETNDHINKLHAAADSYDVNAGYLDFSSGPNTTAAAPQAITQAPHAWDNASGMVAQQGGGNNSNSYGAVQSNRQGSFNDSLVQSNRQGSFNDSLDFTVPSTDEMLSIKQNSAPPPTMDSLNEATGALSLASQNNNNYGGGNFNSNSGTNFNNNMNNFNNNPGNNNNSNMNNFNNNAGHNMNNFNNNTGNSNMNNFNNNARNNNNYNSNANNNTFNSNNFNNNNNNNNNFGNNHNFNNTNLNNNFSSGNNSNNNSFSSGNNSMNNNFSSNTGYNNSSDPFSNTPAPSGLLHAPMPPGPPPPPPPGPSGNPFSEFETVGSGGMSQDTMLSSYGGGGPPQQHLQASNAGYAHPDPFDQQQLALTSTSGRNNNNTVPPNFDNPFGAL